MMIRVWTCTTGAAVNKISGKPGAMKVAYTDSDGKSATFTWTTSSWPPANGRCWMA